MVEASVAYGHIKVRAPVGDGKTLPYLFPESSEALLDHVFRKVCILKIMKGIQT
jgi:hypothetical protein